MSLQPLSRRIIVCVVTALVAVGAGTPARAAVTSVTISPSTWTPSSSQAFTLTLEITGSVNYVGLWQSNGPGTRTWTLSRTGVYSGNLSGTTLTCATTGVTYTSAMFTGWGNGVKPGACYDDQDSDWFEIGANIAGASASGPGTVVISIPAGLLTAPAVVGTTVLQAIANPDSPVNFNAVVTAAAPATADIVNLPPASHLQAVGLPTTESCTDVDDTDLAWGTGLTGGWKRSWGAWLNDGLGGWACSRTLVNIPGTQRWLVS